MVHLEQTPDDEELLATIFRSAHTLKGTARMMKLIPISEMAHRLEDILDALRSGGVQHTKELSWALFKGVDALSEMVRQVSDGKSSGDADSDLLKLLENAAKGGIEASTEQTVTGREDFAGDLSFPESQSNSISDEAKNTTQSYTNISDQNYIGPNSIGKNMSRSAVKFSDIANEKSSGTPRDLNAPITSETIRIQSDKLDNLIKCIGELVTCFSRFQSRAKTIRKIERYADSHQNHITHHYKKELGVTDSWSNGRDDLIIKDLAPLYSEIEKLADHFKEDMRLTEPLLSDLQAQALEMRMLPLSTIFDGLQRSVRDLAVSYGKKISLIVHGGQTEMDKKIIESLSDPLLHMIRNSIDHGIETPEDRTGCGKPIKGTIKVIAGYEGGKVLITVADDGCGIPIDKITEKALFMGIITETALRELSDTEKLQLIFQPGLSSADIITDLSGRGVGMDVVRRNIEDDLKRSIQIQTAKGKGTTFLIRLPLTIALLPLFLVQIGSRKFAIPATYVSEIVRLPANQWIDVTDKKAIRLRDDIIPIVRLAQMLDISETPDEEESLIMITSIDGVPLGMNITEVLGEREMVIKPLPSHMEYVKLVTGVIVSDNNEIIPVLHVPHIVASSRLMRSGEKTANKAMVEQEPIANRILVVDDSASTREIEKSILEAYGYDVSVAADGVNGFEQCMESRFDLIISDVDMPNMDGFTMTSRLRAQDEYMDTPIILVTARDSEEDKRKGITVGANAYIIKGDFEQGNLLETIQNLI